MNVKSVVSRIDPAKLNPAVKSALVNRGYSDEEMGRMSPREAFVEYCEWHGLINWGDTLWEQAKGLMFMDTPSPAPQPELAAAEASSSGSAVGEPVSMAEKFVAAYSAWEESGVQQDFKDWVVGHRLIGEDLSFLSMWNLRPDPERSRFDYALMDFEDGSIAVRRNHDDDPPFALHRRWLVAGPSGMSRRLEKCQAEEGTFYGTIKGHRDDKLFLEGLGIKLGDFDDLASAFHAALSPASVERLKAFSADFKADLHFRPDSLGTDDRDLEQYTVDELMAEKAFYTWWLNSDMKTTFETAKPSRVTDFEVNLHQVDQELVRRRSLGQEHAGAAHEKGTDPSPMA